MPSKNYLMIDPEAFNAAKEMMQTKFERIIGYYLEDVRAYIDTIKEGLEKKDAGMVVPAAHTIKSSSRQIGAFAIANYAANIEESARDCAQNKEEFSKLEHRSENLESMFAATQKEIKEQM